MLLRNSGFAGLNGFHPAIADEAGIRILRRGSFT